MSEKTTFKKKFRSGERITGSFLVLPDEIVAETASLAGFDYVIVDMQHGLFGHDTMRRMVAAVELGNAAPIVRVAPGDDYAVGRALDAGATGLIIPLVNDADDVERAVSAATYGPAGTRSFGPMRAMTREGIEYFNSSKDRIVILPQIETLSALENLDEIVRVPGIDGVYVGPMDLSIALGLQPALDSDEPVFIEAVDRVVAACNDAGIVPTMHAGPQLAAKRYAQGFTAVTIAVDISVLKSGFDAALVQAHASPN